MQHSFGSSEPFTLGVEEELFLVDPVSGRQINSSAAVLQRLGELDGNVARELHACQVELISDVCSSAPEAVRAIGALRRAVADTGVGILASGTHPSAREGEAEITDKERYEHIRYLLGDAVATPISGLHVHVGMPIHRPRSGCSTPCAATCPSSRPSPPTPRFATVAIPVWRPRAR
jgi:glutamate---cysteine ligase / carboxylate-amine ligase